MKDQIMELKRVFRGVPKGKIHPVTYSPGDDLPVELHAAAKAVGADQEPEEKPSSPPVEPQRVSQRSSNAKTTPAGSSSAKAEKQTTAEGGESKKPKGAGGSKEGAESGGSAEPVATVNAGEGKDNADGVDGDKKGSDAGDHGASKLAGLG